MPASQLRQTTPNKTCRQPIRLSQPFRVWVDESVAKFPTVLCGPIVMGSGIMGARATLMTDLSFKICLEAPLSVQPQSSMTKSFPC